MAVILRLVLRYCRPVVLSTTLFLAFLLITLQVRQPSPPLVLTKRALLATIAPFIKGTALVSGAATSVWRDYIDLRGVQSENRRLREEVARLQLRLEALEEQSGAAPRLERLLDLKVRAGGDLVAARVIGKDATNWFRTLFIDRGSADGLRRNMPVVASQGLVGRVVEVTGRTAKVQLITDPVSAVGALVQRSRVSGILAGDIGPLTRVRYLPLMADVVEGDQVLTSGTGGVFPKGILIGTVASVERRSGALFQEALLKPAVDFAALEEVLVLREAPDGFEAWGLEAGGGIGAGGIRR